jgi:hypothetical protein
MRDLPPPVARVRVVDPTFPVSDPRRDESRRRFCSLRCLNLFCRRARRSAVVDPTELEQAAMAAAMGAAHRAVTWITCSGQGATPRCSQQADKFGMASSFSEQRAK